LLEVGVLMWRVYVVLDFENCEDLHFPSILCGLQHGEITC
jgi:hypothetical protein